MITDGWFNSPSGGKPKLTSIISLRQKALKSYEGIIDYIEEKFNDIAVQKFVRKTLKILAHISRNPAMSRKSEKGKNKHLVVLTRKTTLYYRVKPRKKEVELLLFWDNRRNPAKLKH